MTEILQSCCIFKRNPVLCNGTKVKMENVNGKLNARSIIPSVNCSRYGIHMQNGNIFNSISVEYIFIMQMQLKCSFIHQKQRSALIITCTNSKKFEQIKAFSQIFFIEYVSQIQIILSLIVEYVNFSANTSIKSSLM